MLKRIIKKLMPCDHPKVEGIYGDPIWQTLKTWSGNIARVRCSACGKPLYNLTLSDIEPYNKIGT